MVHERRVKHAYLQCTENTPRFRGIVDGEKRTEHICASNKFATEAKWQQRRRRRHKAPVHCEMFNLVLTLNSIRSLIRFAFRSISGVDNLPTIGCMFNGDVTNICVVIVVVINNQFRHGGICRILLRDALHLSSANAPTPGYT